MSEHIINPKIPFVWNEPKIIEGEKQYESVIPFESYLKSASSVFGIVLEINFSGIEYLEKIFSEFETLKGKLVIFVGAAGETKATDLEKILDLKQKLPTRFDTRLQALKSNNQKPANILFCFNSANSEAALFTGSAVNFNQTDQSDLFPPIANLAFRCDTALQKSFCEWFDYLWSKSTLLSEKTIKIPMLVPARGTPEAAQMWEEYLAKCEAERKKEEIDADEQNAENVVDSKEEEKKTATEELGVPKVDDVAEKIARIFELGSQITIDKSTRIPPFDAPIKPLWFGVESLRQVGAISRRVQYRISVIDKDTLKKLDAKRKKASGLLKQISFPLGDGVHWMPDKAFAYFEAEMSHINEEGQKQFKSTIGDNVDAFVDSKKEQIIKDANQMLQDFKPGGEISVEHQNELILDLKSRLQKANGEKFLPEVSRIKVSFKANNESQWESAWGQALTFLTAIAEFPRKAQTDRFFLQGVKTDFNDLLEAMNVCNDHLFSKDLKIAPWRKAEEDLKFLENIADTDFTAKSKCEAILRLMESKSEEEIWTKLVESNEEKENVKKEDEIEENVDEKQNYESKNDQNSLHFDTR